MDHVADSDTENTLPELSVADIDTGQLRNVVALFSADTRHKLRQEAQNTPFASVFDLSEPLSPGNGLDSGMEPFLSQQVEFLLEQLPVQVEIGSLKNPGGVPEEPTTTTDAPEPVNVAARSSRSLRKRTFASRHPYIADQADWLGICTHDNINEMFDGDEDISRVVRALNQLYLQKKRRYPDEDRYRSKDFYTHLGHSKSLALQGDSEVRGSDVMLRQSQEPDETEPLDSQERNYDPDAYSSAGEAEAEADASANEDEELIPYDEFEIPYTQERGENGAYSDADLQPNQGLEPPLDVKSASSASSASEAEEEEQYIRVGGRYRKVSTILRGVLPELAKRLGIFDTKPAPKRRRPSLKPFVPRRGLAMRKHGSSTSNTAELERELYSHAEEEIDDGQRPQLSPLQLLITEHASGKVDRPRMTHDVPSLTRSNTSFTYVSDTPEPQYIGSGSDSEDGAHDGLQMFEHNGENRGHESTLHSYRTASEKPQHSKSRQTGGSNYMAEGDEVIEYDEIDHLLAPRNSILKRKPIPRSRHKQPSLDRKPSGARQRQTRTPRVSLGRPAATQRAPRANSKARSRPRKVIDRVQSRLSAFRGSLGQKRPNINTKGPATPIVSTPKTSKEKQKEKQKEKKQNGDHHVPFHQPFKRNPIMSTSAIEVESERPYKSVREPVYGSAVHQFQPSRLSLLERQTFTPSNSLTGFDDISGVRGLKDGRMFFPNEDTASIVFLGKPFPLVLFNLEESSRNVVSFLTSLRRLMASPKMLLQSETRLNVSTALKQLMKWALISRQRPQGAMWAQMRGILSGFSKLQTKEVRAFQVIIQSQLLYLFWIWIQLEMRYKSDMVASLAELLQGFTCDYFVALFSSFTAQEFSAAFAEGCAHHDLAESIMLVFTIFEYEDRCWWPVISEAIDEMVLVKYELGGVLDVTYLLCAIIPKRFASWGPLLTILSKLKNANVSSGHRHFIETCEMVHQRLEWPLDERILTQLYGFFGLRKFSNFSDECNVPSSVGKVYSRGDIPRGSVFERFLGLLYNYMSDLSLAKDIKRLVSKLLASSQYHYIRGRKSQIMFANRLNLIVLLAQTSDVDLSNQLTQLVKQIRDSGDAFVYGRSLDALQVLSETSLARNKPLPTEAFAILFETSAIMTNTQKIGPGIFQKLVDLMGHTFRGVSEKSGHGVFGLLGLLGQLDLSKVPKSSVLEVLGTVFLSVMEVEMIDQGLNPLQAAVMADFQKLLLAFLSIKMNQFPLSNQTEDTQAEEVVELGLQIWLLAAKVSHTRHWNNMMYQKFSYLGNSIARHRFVMLFCLEFLQYGPVDSFVLQEIEKIFLAGLVSPSVSKYAVDLLKKISGIETSIFTSKGSALPEISLVASLQTFRLRLITRSLENILASQSLHINEKIAAVSSLVKRLHDVYTDHRLESGVLDMCKRVMETLLKVAKSLVANIDEFWELSVKLGFPNKNVQSKWVAATDEAKVSLLNSELISALAYGKSYVAALDNWKTETNNFILFSLVEVYLSAVTSVPAYWAHTALLLEYVLAKMCRFEVATNEHHFRMFLLQLKEVSLMSNCQSDSRYTIHEIKALTACCLILENALFIFDGFKDKTIVKHVVYEFTANMEAGCPRRYQPTRSFMSISIEQVQSSNHVSYNPKHQHTPEEYMEAWRELKELVENLSALVSERTFEKAVRLDNFKFL